jgi:hypothetical protein
MGSEAEVPWSIVMMALVVRLVGVFVVLVALGLGIQASGAIVSRLQTWRERKAPDG